MKPAIRIDSHLHLWDLARGDYGWVTPELGALNATFSPGQAAAALAESGIDGAILVQAADTLSDTEYMLDVAASNDWVLGVVGWVELIEPRRAAEQLDRWQMKGLFSGVRSLIHTDPRSNLLDLPSVRQSLRDVSGRGLPFDVPDAWPTQLHRVPSLAREIPELTIVLDHLAKPPQDSDEFEAWRSELARVAGFDRVVAKLSGLHRSGVDYTVHSVEPAWDTALELFGPTRLMWGSDWPMTVPHGGYAQAFEVLFALISTLSPTEQSHILGGSAALVYSLDA